MTDGAAEMVRSHYIALGELYRAAWGDSLHFAVFFSPTQDRDSAVAATQRMLADEAGMRPGMSVLDVGCGTGGPALAITKYSGAHITGLDLVSDHVDDARARAAEQGLSDRTTFLECDATDLPFSDACFDHVYAIESAYHVADKGRLYRECARVLRPGGCFVGTDWLRGERPSAAEAYQTLAQVHEHFGIPELIDIPALRRHLTAAGLIPEVVEDMSRLGDVKRNWDTLDVAVWPRLARAARRAPPNALRTYADGARALAQAAASGLFVLGHWRARKPVGLSGA